MIRPYKLTDGSVIFKGRDAIYRPSPKINVRDIIHEHFEVTAESQSVAIVDKRLEEICSSLPFNKSRLIDLAIAVSEAVNNAIMHGPQDIRRIVSIDVLYLPRVMLYVFVRDDCGKICIKDINLDISETFDTDEHGRGFLVMASYVNVLAYFPDDTSSFKEIILGLEPENNE